MNEQIKEFLVKARVQDRGYFIYQYGGTTGHQSIEKAIDLEKFAELIVRECIDRINRVGILEDIEFQSGMIAQNVREHFGVEGSFCNEILCEQNLRTPV